MKSYTDLEQSKKLAEFLPLESADMYYEEVCNLPKVIVGNYTFHNQCMEDKDYKKLSNPVLSPAWSLAALLDVLPEVSLNTFKDGTWNAIVQHDGKMIYVDKDNPIDACVAMIENLHEFGCLPLTDY